MASFQDYPGGVRVFVCRLGVRDSRTFTKEEGGKPAAKKWAALREAEIIKAGKVAKSVKGYTVRQMLEKYQAEVMPKREDNFVWESNRIKWFLTNLSFTGTYLRSDELVADIQEWVDERSNVVSGASINRDIQFLSPIFERARKQWKWLDRNPLTEIDRPQNSEPRNMRILPEHERAIVEALGYVEGTPPVSKRDLTAVAFLLALETGMRKGELLKTHPRNVHADYIHLPAAITKTRRKRNVPLPPRAIRLVGLLQRGEDTLLHGLGEDTLDAMFRDARSVVGLPDLHFHDTRHEAVTRLAKKLTLLPLAEMIGHSDINSLRVYYNPTASEIATQLREAEATQPA